MDARLQRRVQRYGWDRAADAYASLWGHPLAPARSALLDRAELAADQRVLDVACGTGAVAFAAAARVGRAGRVVGVDLSGRMVDVAAGAVAPEGSATVTFERMDGEALDLPDGRFDAVLCAFGLMYMPDPDRALREMRRVLRPGGRLAVAVWGERARCAWAPVFGIVDDAIAGEVCPLFFRLGSGDALAEACAAAGFASVASTRMPTTLRHADADEACRAVFVGGPVALAWSRLDVAARDRVRARYLDAIAPWRSGHGFHLPSEFLVVDARAA